MKLRVLLAIFIIEFTLFTSSGFAEREKIIRTLF
jgi:hypothetical protein